jgi:hypothetical protein
MNWTNNETHRLSAPAWLTARQVRIEKLEPELLKINTTFPLPYLPNQPRDCYQIIGEDEASLGDANPTNL